MNQDWANLNKYKNDNLLLQPAEPGQSRIVFMGDSITEFWSQICPDFFANKPFINRGISGQTTPQMLIRFRADVVALKPSLVIILAGINDIAGNTGASSLEMISNNLFSMIEIAKANQLKVVLCSVLPAFDFPWKKRMEPARKITALNAQLKSHAIANDIYYLDYFSVMVDDQLGMKKEFSDDGVHPNKAGYQVMAPLVKEAIQKVLE